MYSTVFCFVQSISANPFLGENSRDEVSRFFTQPAAQNLWICWCSIKVHCYNTIQFNAVVEFSGSGIISCRLSRCRVVPVCGTFTPPPACWPIEPLGFNVLVCILTFMATLLSKDPVKFSELNSDFQIKFLFLVLSFQERIALVYF